MKIRPVHQLPPDKEAKLVRAQRLEWISIFFLVTIIATMFLTMGSSQAMKTAWIEDILSLVPPISFLVAMRFRSRPPNQSFPYGYRRVTLLSFLIASVAVLLLGSYMLFDAARSLIGAEHPTLGHFQLFGYHLWIGWVMIAALIYSMIPPLILGHIKIGLAKEIHEKTLFADAAMNKADWMTAASAILGILGVGVGLWWADAVAAGFIALDVTRDGYSNVRRAMGDLMDHRPTEVSGDQPLGLADRITERVRQNADVSAADCRLREEGNLVSGEVFVVLAPQENIARRMHEIGRQAAEIDWRIYDLVVTAVESLDDHI